MTESRRVLVDNKPVPKFGGPSSTLVVCEFGGGSASFPSHKLTSDHAFGGCYGQFCCRRWLLRLVEMQNTCLRGQNGQDTWKIRGDVGRANGQNLWWTNLVVDKSVGGAG